MRYSDLKNRKVLVTGHTGFKGSWLTLWLNKLGARVTGVSLDPKNSGDAYFALRISDICEDLRHDINDYYGISSIFMQVQPEIVFHLAAQPLVLESYRDPVYTLNTNIIGTANLLEACRKLSSVKAIIIVTSDKCYENAERTDGYKENDRLGGKDPYSASKAAAEIISASYRESFFNGPASPALATVRAGNVIGGGDWAENRILPDSIKALLKEEPVEIRNPDSVRPWQYVLEPLGGYLLLAEKMLTDPKRFSGPWNFGPGYDGLRTVRELVEEVIKCWGTGTWMNKTVTDKLHEAGLLTLNIDKAKEILKWSPVLHFSQSVEMATEWYKAQSNRVNMAEFSGSQIDIYQSMLK
jgi:CDP-glucose 4,6-dehydratase